MIGVLGNKSIVANPLFILVQTLIMACVLLLSVRNTIDLENYLGLLVVVRSNKKHVFRAIKDRFLGKIRSWYNRYLS